MIAHGQRTQQVDRDSRRHPMSSSLTWIGLAFGVVVVTMFIEYTLRTLINRRGELPDPTQHTYSK
jgi:hypothetical protein